MDHLMRMQLACDLVQTRKRSDGKVTRYQRKATRVTSRRETPEQNALALD